MSPNTLSNWHWVGESGSDGLLTPGTNVRLVQPIVTGDRAHMGSEVRPPRAKRNSEKILFSAAELSAIHCNSLETCSISHTQED